VISDQTPEILKGSTIYSLDMGALLAGTRYRGDFEERLKLVMKELEKDPKAVLFIDEIHTVIGAGATSGGAMDASNLLKPSLQSGTLRCMGSTTYKEYRNHFEKDRALARRFQKIDVVEPTTEDSIKILNGLKQYFEEHHKIKYSSESLKTAVELANKYIHDRKLPDKAIDVIDEAGAAQSLLPPNKKKKVIGVKEIEEIIAKIARIPSKRISKNDSEVLRDLERSLKRVVFGQETAIEMLASSIKLSRAGLREPEKPIGCYLFAGPTGVGKTEVCKQLADILGISMLRFDMSEYMEKHSVSRLLGADPGFVGFEEGGLLTEKVRQSPYSVLLFDEIEKAHIDIFNLFLQILDDGQLTDSQGRRADFRNTLNIMTTNIGHDLMREDRKKKDVNDLQKEARQLLLNHFRPEFLNRIDEIIPFRNLSLSHIRHICRMQLEQLQTRLTSQGIQLEMTEAAEVYLAQRGYDPIFGARPMKRTLQRDVQDPIAIRLLEGELQSGMTIQLDASQNKLHFKIS
jgi:ATP-dependent Clp protease ATP-binding subunit ClpA